MKRHWIALGVSFSVIGHGIAADARPAEVFQPYLGQIQKLLPPETAMRLPTEILLGGPGLAPDEINQLIVNVLPSESPPRLTVSLATCESAPYPCLIGSFSVENVNSAAAQQALYEHQLKATPITLSESVMGYLQEGNRLTPPSEVSSVIWAQDDMVYTVRFLAAERQNILYMAQSMVMQEPIRGVVSNSSR
ncbi:hypothetical protein IFO70_18570 [Phormidium tenue FACHB-886]|nr:hypothetical protein [Phormidium tenue FACHB-886]